MTFLLHSDNSRAIDGGFFDYEETLDEETKREIAEIKSEAKNRKKIFGRYYTILLVTVSVLQLLKKPVTYALKGRGINAKDGENGLIFEPPFGLYAPYAEHWIPYLLAMFIGYTSAHYILVTGLGSIVQYQYMAEELIAELTVVKKTFTKCLLRAEMMFQTRSSSKHAVEEHLTMDDCIIHCINFSVKHHQHTLRMMDLFKKLMYYPLFAVIFDGGLILCISSFILINDDVSMMFRVPMPFVVAVEALIAFTFCFYGGKLTEANVNVGNGVYDCDGWMFHSKTLRPYALVVKGYCDIPNELSAAGFTSVNERTFVNLLSAAYSYIGFMLSR